MPMTSQQQANCARTLAEALFAKATATINHADLLAAVQALDAAFDATLTQGVVAFGGGTTVINALAGAIPAPASGGTAQQKTLLACYVLMGRAGLLS
jgi:hypothetical protein